MCYGCINTLCNKSFEAGQVYNGFINTLGDKS